MRRPSMTTLAGVILLSACTSETPASGARGGADSMPFVSKVRASGAGIFRWNGCPTEANAWMVRRYGSLPFRFRSPARPGIP